MNSGTASHVKVALVGDPSKRTPPPPPVARSGPALGKRSKKSGAIFGKPARKEDWVALQHRLPSFPPSDRNPLLEMSTVVNVRPRNGNEKPSATFGSTQSSQRSPASVWPFGGTNTGGGGGG